MKKTQERQTKRAQRRIRRGGKILANRNPVKTPKLKKTAASTLAQDENEQGKSGIDSAGRKGRKKNNLRPALPLMKRAKKSKINPSAIPRMQHLELNKHTFGGTDTTSLR